MKNRKEHPAIEPECKDDAAPPVPRIENCWLRRPEAAAHLGISQSLLETLDSLGDGSPCARLGRVRIYKRSLLDRYAADRSQSNTPSP